MSEDADHADRGAQSESPPVLSKNKTYILDGEVYLVFRDRLWRRTGQTYNPRVIALADAVSDPDSAGLLSVHKDGVEVLLQHHMAGIVERLLAFERVDPPAYVTWEEVDALEW